MMQLRLQCCLLVLSLVAAAAQAETEVQPRDRLAKMTRAFSELSYDGTFSYFSGNDLASLRVIHKVVDGQQRERLVHLNGDSREIIRHGDEVLCIVMPGDDLLELESSIPAGPFARAFVRAFDNIDEHYRLVELSRERVADRAASVLMSCRGRRTALPTGCGWMPTTRYC